MNTAMFTMLKDEKKAGEFLVQQGVIKRSRICPSCGSTGTLLKTRIRCQVCGRIWNEQEKSILEGSKLSASDFITIVSCFSSDQPVTEASRHTEIPESTMWTFYQKIRRAILNGTGQKTGMSWHENDGSSPSPVQPVAIGICSTGGVIAAKPSVIPAVELIITLRVPRTIQGNILFIDLYSPGFAGYIIYYPDRRGQETVLVRRRNSESWSPLDEFWRFSEKMWRQHRDLERKDIPAFVQEIVFRYNHRNPDLFCAVIKKIAEYDYVR